MANDEIRIDEHPRRGPLGRLGHKAIINNSNLYEVQMPPEHLIFQVIDTLLAVLLPLFADESLPENQLEGEDLCRLLLAEIPLLRTDEGYHALVSTLTTHRHDPHDSRWIRVMNCFDALEEWRYTILENKKGAFIADWKNNHVEGSCEIKEASKPFRRTNAQLAAVQADPARPSLAKTLPLGVIQLRGRKSSGPSLRDFSPTNPRLPAIKAATS